MPTPNYRVKLPWDYHMWPNNPEAATFRIFRHLAIYASHWRLTELSQGDRYAEFCVEPATMQTFLIYMTSTLDAWGLKSHEQSEFIR